MALAADPPAFLLVDHYAFDARWHDAVRAGLDCPLGVIDDLGDRPLAVDLIVDPTLDEDHRAKHWRSLSRSPILLCGPDHAILSPAYRHPASFEVQDRVESVGIFMGGSDVGNATALAWQAVRDALGSDIPIEIATTSANPHLGTLSPLAAGDPNTSLLIDAPHLAGFFARHGLQIGAGGGASWERCCIGAPAVVIAFADNQLLVTRPLHDEGVLFFSEEGGRDVSALSHDIREVAADPSRRRAMSERARAMVDGRGVERVANAIVSGIAGVGNIRLREATSEDARMAYGWRNAEPTRRYFRQSAAVALSDHLAWWGDALGAPARHLLIAEREGVGVGVVRFDIEGVDAEISIYLDPDRAGRGLGSSILHATADRALLLGLACLHAEIDPANIASQRAFARAGFDRLDERKWTLRLAS